MTRSWQFNKLRIEIIKRDNFRCVRCGKEQSKRKKVNGFRIFEDNLVVDHIIPIKMGGSELEESNLQTLCIDCNNKKTHWDKYFINSVKKLKIFRSNKDDA